MTSTLYSYDAMGRVTNMWECQPSTCGTSQQTGRQVLYNYDWAGNITGEGDYVAGGISYTRSPAGEVTSIYNTTNWGSGNPQNLVSNVVNGPNGPISYTLGNGDTVQWLYDNRGRNNGGWVCNNGSVSPGCGGGTIYGYGVTFTGNQITGTTDLAENQTRNYTYDEFDRLYSTNINSGQQTFQYPYDQYGNRWAQNAPQGGSSFSASFNLGTNQINTSGYAYDAAGNMTNDGLHSYRYDADGNILSVDGGGTAAYFYDALNRRVSVQTSGGTTEYMFDNGDHRTSSWPVGLGYGNEARLYWDGAQFAVRISNGQTYFDHRNFRGHEARLHVPT